MPTWTDPVTGQKMRGTYLQYGLASGKAFQNQQDQQVLNEADLYRQALQKAAYGEASRGLSSGLQGIQGYLSTRGPLADSGAPAALSARLAQGLYGGAANRVAGGYAQYLAQAMNARRQYQYQLALLKAQKKAMQTGIGGVVGGIAGAALGGPFGGALGGYLGNKVFGGGGGYENGLSPNYYGY